MTILSPLPPSAWGAFLESAVRQNAQDAVASGQWRAGGALERSRAEFEGFFPQGLATPHCYFHQIKAAADGPAVGAMCYGLIERGGARSAFVCHLEIYPEWRRQGHAFRAFRELEALLAAQGVATVDLHVFRHNGAAQALYAKLGYAVTGLHMAKQLVRTGGELQ